MPLYTFHCRRLDGAPVSFHACDLVDDLAARAHAARLLIEHLSCDLVETYDGERLVNPAPLVVAGHGLASAGAA